MESKCFFRDLFLSLASECKNGEEIESGLCINELISFTVYTNIYLYIYTHLKWLPLGNRVTRLWYQEFQEWFLQVFLRVQELGHLVRSGFVALIVTPFPTISTLSAMSLHLFYLSILLQIFHRAASSVNIHNISHIHSPKPFSTKVISGRLTSFKCRPSLLEMHICMDNKMVRHEHH